MKKSVAALAILAASGAALAQSNVTIYGRVDLGVTHQNDGTSSLPGGGAAGTTEVREGSGSRLGFRGTEDLGGGLKAGFVIEHRFTPDTGAATSSTSFWRGRSIVELSSATFGTVYLGREYAPAESVGKAADPFAWDTVGQLGRAITWANYGSIDGERHNNALGWRSPKFGGFSFAAAVAAREGATNGGAAGFSAEYKAGPLYVGLGYDTRYEQTTPAVAGGRQDDDRMMLVTGAYDFGLLRASLSYAASTVSDADYKAYSLGLSVPLGTGSLKAAYGVREQDNATNDLTKIGLGYEYPLSKRTALYAGVGSAEQDGRTRATAYNLGVRHNF